MFTRLIAFTALLVAATALALVIAFAEVTGRKLQDMEAPMPAWTGPVEQQA